MNQRFSLVYDAAAMSRILGLPCQCGDPIPEAANGETVVYYGGWDLRQLRRSAAGGTCMWQKQVWYDKYDWKVEPGYYHLLLPVPGSNHKTQAQQVRYLSGIGTFWQPAPTLVACCALLAHLTVTGKDLLNNNWCRCLEVLAFDVHAALMIHEGRVYLDRYLDDGPRGRAWLSAARKS